MRMKYFAKYCEINRYQSEIEIFKNIASHCKTCCTYFSLQQSYFYNILKIYRFFFEFRNQIKDTFFRNHNMKLCKL